MKKTVLALGAAAGVYAALSAVSSYAIDSQYPFIKKRTFTPLPQAETAERVTVKNADGLTLVGHWVRAKNPKRVVIALHGWRSNWQRDFSTQCAMLQELDCDVLYVDQRAHGESGGRYIGFGYLERFDCLEWLNYVKTDLPVYLIGVSMGATSVMLASELIAPGKVRGIIADCGFTSGAEIWRHRMGLKGRGADAAAFFSDMYAWKKADYRGGSRSTLQALQNTDIPFLFIHGGDDTFVPTRMVYENHGACVTPKRLLVVPGARHAKSCAVDPARYREALSGFFADQEILTGTDN